jgi:hypothetical protein
MIYWTFVNGTLEWMLWIAPARVSDGGGAGSLTGRRAVVGYKSIVVPGSRRASSASRPSAAKSR